MQLIFLYAIIAAISPSPHNITLWINSDKNQNSFILGALVLDFILIGISQIVKLSQPTYILLSLLSIGYLIYIMFKKPQKNIPKRRALSFSKGLSVQLLNPFPWIFWISIAPTINLNFNTPLALILFLGIIYGFKLISSKIIYKVNFSKSTSVMLFKLLMPSLSIGLITKYLVSSF